MEIDGKVIVITDAQGGISKNGNAWQKQGFVIETADRYPRCIFFELFGEKMSMMPKIGDTVRVTFDISGSNFNGRWYNQISAWKVCKLTAEPIGAAQQISVQNQQTQQPTQSAYTPPSSYPVTTDNNGGAFPF